jgi:hypothetical protein
MAGGVLVLGVVAAADMAAFRAEAEMDPGVAGLQAVFAAQRARLDRMEVVRGEVGAGIGHGVLLLRAAAKSFLASGSSLAAIIAPRSGGINHAPG